MALVPGGSFPASIIPAQDRVTIQDNYIDFQAGAFNQWAQQYLPELYEQEVERYGNRTLSGFLRMVGAEMPMTSDQVIWSEQNRLHIAYETTTVAVVGAMPTISVVITLPAANPAGAVRVGSTILLADNATGLTTIKALVTAVTGATLNTLACTVYGTAIAIPPAITAGTCNMFVYGSEFPKGSDGMNNAIEPAVTTFQNSPIILKDNYELSGSDAAQVGSKLRQKMELQDTYGILKLSLKQD